MTFLDIHGEQSSLFTVTKHKQL